MHTPSPGRVSSLVLLSTLLIGFFFLFEALLYFAFCDYSPFGTLLFPFWFSFPQTSFYFLSLILYLPVHLLLLRPLPHLLSPVVDPSLVSSGRETNISNRTRLPTPPSTAMADNTTVLPPLKAVTDTDHGGILAITASLGLVFGVVSLLIRTYVRIECRASFGRDDYTAFVSMVFALIQAVIIFLAISRGFGEIVAELTPEAILAWQRDVFISDIFYLIGMWLTKSSIALLLMRLSRDPFHGVMARVLLAASAIYFVVSVFVVSIRCDISQPWNDAVDGCPASIVGSPPLLFLPRYARFVLHFGLLTSFVVRSLGCRHGPGHHHRDCPLYWRSMARPRRPAAVEQKVCRCGCLRSSAAGHLRSCRPPLLHPQVPLQRR